MTMWSTSRRTLQGADKATVGVVLSHVEPRSFSASGYDLRATRNVGRPCGIRGGPPGQLRT